MNDHIIFCSHDTSVRCPGPSHFQGSHIYIIPKKKKVNLAHSFLYRAIIPKVVSCKIAVLLVDYNATIVSPKN